MAFILRRLLSPFTGRRTDGSPFIFKCLAVTCVFLLIEGVFIVHRWIKASEITTWELENMIPIEEGNNQHRRNKLFGEDELLPRLTTSSSSIEPNILTECPLQHSNLLFFIRIPKCGSTSFVSLLRTLSSQQRFELLFNPSGAYNWNQKEPESVAHQLSIRGKPTIYARHFYYVDFREYGLQNYSYVTVIRDPLSRFVSSYLYYHFSSKPHIQSMLKLEHRNESIAQCIARKHNGCSHNLLTKYFCGHAAYCSKGTTKALRAAKKNMKENFIIVGILEKMEKTLGVLKKVLPLYFSLMTESIFPIVNKNEHSKILTAAEREAIQNANLADIELYRYSEQLLREKALACHITI